MQNEDTIKLMAVLTWKDDGFYTVPEEAERIKACHEAAVSFIRRDLDRRTRERLERIHPLHEDIRAFDLAGIPRRVISIAMLASLADIRKVLSAYETIGCVK